MAKPHKFMWNGIDIVTSLDPARLAQAIAGAMSQTKGKVHLMTDVPDRKTYEIRGSDTFFATSAELSFDIQVSEESGGRWAVRTHIMRCLLKDGSIPFGPKNMLGQKAFMRFNESFAAYVAYADPTASISLRQGPMPDGFPLHVLSTRVAPPRPVA